MSIAAVIVLGCCFGLGTVGIALSWQGNASFGRSRSSSPTTARLGAGDLALAVAAAVTGCAAGILTRWPAAVLLAAGAVYGVPKLFVQTSGSVSIAKIEAIATWTEMLQGTLAASAGLGQAIMATGPLSPLPIRGATTRLSSRLGAGMHPREALALLADELEDPCSDRVVCALHLAISARAQQLGELLAALADSTREEVALRLRIETSRASVRSGVRTVLVFSVAFAVSLTVVAHSYLAPFGTLHGELVLLVVGTLYAVGLSLMVSLARPPAPVRLLGREVVGQ
jgi:hypothetical protein